MDIYILVSPVYLLHKQKQKKQKKQKKNRVNKVRRKQKVKHFTEICGQSSGEAHK